VESAIYDRHWGDLANAFSQRGLGLGWTKRTAMFGARIDHILASDRLYVQSATVGEALGSDHRVLIVEMKLRP
jgi:endonuclease/exonuclease/phosphatase (EEP) superfamily protein YafD